MYLMYDDMPKVYRCKLVSVFVSMIIVGVLSSVLFFFYRYIKKVSCKCDQNNLPITKLICSLGS